MIPMEPVWVQYRCCDTGQRCERCGSERMISPEPAVSERDWLTCLNCGYMWGPRALASTAAPHRASLATRRRTPIDISPNSIRRRLFIITRGIVLVTIVAGTQAHLESVRWWLSPPVESAIGITSRQSTAIEQLYEDSLPAQRHAGEHVVELTAQVATRVRLGEYDDELLRLTAELVKARSVQCELRRQMLERAAGPLSPQQRTKLARFIAEKGVME